jgi:hypothetical protein
MSFTIPIIIKEIKDVPLPFYLYQNDNFNIFISEFPVSEREELFDIKIHEILESGVKFTRSIHTVSNHTDKFSEFVSAKYKVGVITKDNSKEQTELFNPFSYNLNFCCQLYFDSPITLSFFGDDKLATTQYSIQSYARKSPKKIITLNDLESFKKTFLLCLNDSSIDKKKKHMLASLINISSLQTFNTGLICSTYITILESLFTNENTEITYRFALRLSKYLKEDHVFFKKIKELYGKRSTYYHTGEIKFSFDNEKYLNDLSKKLIVEYIQNPNNFDIVELDQLLLS